MSIPKAVKEILEAQEIKYETIKVEEVFGMERLAEKLGDDSQYLLRVVGFKKANKVVMCVLPYDRVVEVKAVWQWCFSECEVLKDAELSDYFKLCDKGNFPPVPDVFDVQILIDTYVYDLEWVIFQSGSDKSIIKMNKVNANLLFQDCASHTFSSTPVIEGEILNSNQSDDMADDQKENFTATRIKQRINETFDLPAMPEIAQDIMKLRVDPGADAARLAKVVCQDPSLAAQVISWASSPYYGYQGKVTSVEVAIARVLGFDLVMNLALGISIGKSLKVPLDGALGVREFWKRAIYAASLTEKLCAAMPVNKRPERGLIYLSGLLHNFGHLLLGHIFPPQFKLVNAMVEANPYTTIEDLEDFILGVTHEELGAWLMTNWHMPEELITAVGNHHREENNNQHAVYSNLVLVANQLLKRLNIGDAIGTDVSESMMELLSLDKEKLEKALQEIEADSEALNIMAKQLVA